MIFEFKTATDIFMVDLAELKWARISPCNETGDAEILEHGELKPQGMMVYTMYPRTKKDGLCTIGITCVPLGTTLTIFLRVNKEAGRVTDFTLPLPISEIQYQVLE